jgi:hypothetical protein
MKMRNLLLVCMGLLVMAGIVSASFWRDLRTERATNEELRTQLAAARVAPAAPAATAQSIALPAPAVVPGAPAAPVAPAPDSVMASQSLAAAISASVAASVTGSGEKDLLKNPEYRKAQLTIARLRLAQSNPGLAEALGLSEAEADHLFEVMAEQQQKLTAELTSQRAAAGGAALTASEMTRLFSSGDDAIRATLGEARYAQYPAYQQNVRPALTQLASLGSTLTSAGQPLSDSQSRALSTVLLAEQQRLRQEAAAPRPTPNPATPRRMADTLEESYNRQAEGNRRILDAAASNLSPAQLDVLRAQFEQQAATQRRTLDTARDLDARREQTPVGPGRAF